MQHEQELAPKINQDLRNTNQLPFQNKETLPSGHAVNNKQLAVRPPRVSSAATRELQNPSFAGILGADCLAILQG